MAKKILTPSQLSKLESKSSLSRNEYIRLRNHYYALLAAEGFEDLEWSDNNYLSLDTPYLAKSNYRRTMDKTSLTLEIEIYQNFLNNNQRLSSKILLNLRNVVQRFLDCKFDLHHAITPSQFIRPEAVFREQFKNHQPPKKGISSKSHFDLADLKLDHDDSAQLTPQVLRNFNRLFRALNCYFYIILRCEGFTINQITNYFNFTLGNEVQVRRKQTLESLRAAYKQDLFASSALQTLEEFKPVYSFFKAVLGDYSYRERTVHSNLVRIFEQARQLKFDDDDGVNEYEVIMLTNKCASGI